MSRRNWQPIINRASEIVSGYPLGITLRQLHYLLASEPGFGYVNDLGCYKRLSDLRARNAVLIYAGDFDASGKDILRDFVSRCDVFRKTIPIAVLEEQIDSLGLIANRGKGEDSRASEFCVAYPRLATYADAPS